MNLAAASKHFDTQMQLYGRQVLVNLVKKIFVLSLAQKNMKIEC